MTTSEFLSANFGVTMQQAHDFLLANYEANLAGIYSTALEFRVTNAMLGEIAGVPASLVRDYLDGHGFSSAALEPPEPVIYDSLPSTPLEMAGQNSLWADGQGG